MVTFRIENLTQQELDLIVDSLTKKRDDIEIYVFGRSADEVHAATDEQMEQLRELGWFDLCELIKKIYKNTEAENN